MSAHHRGEKRRYCCVVQFKRGSGLGRIREAGPAVVDLLKRWSNGEMELLFMASDGELVGYLLRTDKPPAMMRAEFEGCGETINGDAIIIFEIGEAFNCLGFTRAMTWLQHR